MPVSTLILPTTHKGSTSSLKQSPINSPTNQTPFDRKSFKLTDGTSNDVSEAGGAKQHKRVKKSPVVKLNDDLKQMSVLASFELKANQAMETQIAE